MRFRAGSCRCAGVTVVGVYPTHRRRGVLRAMMRAQIDDIHARGEPIAALWASEETIYGRFGYGMASYTGEISLAREHSRSRTRSSRADACAWSSRARRSSCFRRSGSVRFSRRQGCSGASARGGRTGVVHDPPERREGGGPKRFALLELDGEPQAYAIYRHNPKWDEGSSAARLGIVEAIGATPRGTAEIWRFLLDIDWQASISADLLPIDHPLFFLLAKPRRMKYRLGDGVWVRIVDVGAALSARSYATTTKSCSRSPTRSARGTKVAGSSRAARASERTTPPTCAATSTRSAPSISAASRSPSSRGASAWRSSRDGAIDRADRSSAAVAPWCPEIF